MRRVEETKELIRLANEQITSLPKECSAEGIKNANLAFITTFLGNIAESLAVIADRMEVEND